MSFSLIPPSTPFLGKDGRISRDWWLFFHDMYLQTVGAVDLSESQLFTDSGQVAALVDDAGLAGALLPRAEPVAVETVPNELNAMRDLLTETLKPALTIGPSL